MFNSTKLLEKSKSKNYVKIRETRKKTPEMESFFNKIVSLGCAPIYKNCVHSDSIT